MRTSKIHRFSSALPPYAIVGKIRVQLHKDEEKSMGMASPSLRSDTSLFGEGVRAAVAGGSGNAQLEILRSLLLGFEGSYFSDSR